MCHGLGFMPRFFALIFLVAVGQVCAQSGEGGLAILLFQAHPSGTFRWERWAEATVRLRNERSAPIEARLAVDFPSAPKEGASVVFTRPVTLPARAMIEVNLMVRFPSSAARPKGQEKMLPVRLRLMQGATILAQDVFPCAMQSDEGPAIAWGDVGECSLPYRLKRQAREAGKKAAPAEGGRRAYAIEVVSPDRFPRRATGWGSYDAVVLSRWNAAHRLDVLQSEALAAWVKGGGRLLVLAGAHWNDVPNPTLATLLPLRPSERYCTSYLPALSTVFGDLGIADGVEVYDGDRAAARILLGDARQPFLLERRIGLGATLFLALDVDRVKGADAAGMEQLVRRALAETVRGASAPFFAHPAKTREVVESLVAVKILPRGKIALWLGGYVALAAGLLFGARAFRRGEYGHWGVGVLAVAVALALYGMSRALRREGGEAIERVRAYIAETAMGDASARIEGIEGFFPMKEREFSGRLATDHSLVEPALMGSARAEVIELVTDDEAGVGSWMLQPNTMRALRFDARLAMPAPPLVWSAKLTRHGMLVRAASAFAWPLEGVFLKWNRFVAPVGVLLPRETREIETWKLGDRLGRYQTSNLQGRWTRVEGLLRRMAYPDPRYRFAPLDAIPTVLQQAGAAASRPVAMGGFARASPAFWEKTADDAPVTVGLWLSRGDEDLLEAEDDFWMPQGVARLALDGKSGRISHLGEGDFAGSSEEEIVAAFSLPSACRGAALRGGRVFGGFESLHFKATAEACWTTETDPPSNWKPLAWPAAAAGAEISDPRPGEEKLWVRIFVRRAGSGAPASSFSSLQRWSLRGLDLAISGSKSR